MQRYNIVRLDSALYYLPGLKWELRYASGEMGAAWGSCKESGARLFFLEYCTKTKI
jgi:hypothetical protein